MVPAKIVRMAADLPDFSPSKYQRLNSSTRKPIQDTIMARIHWTRPMRRVRVTSRVGIHW